MKRLIKPAIFIIAILLLVALYLMRYQHLLQRLYFYPQVHNPSFVEAKGQFPKLTMKQVVMLGGAHLRRNKFLIKCPKSSYVSYPTRKKPGIIRIGVFGCSLVLGDEAADGHDMPYLLQDEFNKAGFKNIEVINFGLGGRGVHSWYLLWEYVGKDNNLDYVIFMPFEWHEDRDSSFIYPDDSYFPIHARYILKNGDVELIPVLGNTRLEASSIYYRIIPPWQYIRYDKHMPLFLKALLPSSMQYRTNPFYYKLVRFNKDEIFTTYAILFNKLSKQTDNLIIIANDEKIYNLKKSCSPKIYFLKGQSFIWDRPFLYHAPKGHNSALGNQIRAKELFSLLTGQAKPEFSVIELTLTPKPARDKSQFPAMPLSEYTHITVNCGQWPLASFVTFLSKTIYEGNGKDVDFQQDKIASLLWLPDSNAQNGKFAPLPFLLEDKEEIFLSFKLDDKLVKVPVGFIHAPTGVVGEMVLNWDSARSMMSKGDGWLLEIKDKDVFLRSEGRIEDLCIIIGNNKLPEVESSSKGALISFLRRYISGSTSIHRDISSFMKVGQDFVYLRSKAGQYIDTDTLKEKKGTLDLVLTDKEGHEQRYPIFSYAVNLVSNLAFDPVYPNPILQKK